MKKVCPNCGAETESNFCPDCGYDMSMVEAVICPTCGNETSSRFCPNCGTKVQETDNVVEAKHAEADAVEPVAAEPIVVEPVAVEISAEENTTVETVVEDIQASAMGDSGTIDAIPAQPEAQIGANASSAGSKNFAETLKKKPVIIGIVAAVVLLLIVAIGLGGTSKDASTDYSSDTSSNYSSDSGSYSTTDEGLSYLQGTWKVVGVVNGGETTDTSGYSFGTLVISGNKWNMTLNTTETTNNSGTLYFEMKDQLDDGTYYYVYTMQSDATSGAVKMTYSAKDDFIAVSTSNTVDSNNCIFFAR